MLFHLDGHSNGRASSNHRSSDSVVVHSISIVALVYLYTVSFSSVPSLAPSWKAGNTFG